MKKVFFIGICLFLLTGCSAEYDLTLEKDTFKESFYLYDTKTIFLDHAKTQKGIEKVSAEMFKLEQTRTDFKRTLKQELSQAGYIYETEFKVNNYDNWPTIASACYDDFKITNGKKLTIDTSKAFKCYQTFPYTEDVTIRFKTDYKIIKSNADSVTGDTHIWKITKDNKDNKPLHIEILLKEENKLFTTKRILIFSGIVLIGGIFYLIIQKSKKNNSFT